MIRKLHFGAIISFLTFLLMVGVMASGVVYGAPRYEDSLSAFAAGERGLWAAGCRRVEPETAEPMEVKVYAPRSAIITIKIRVKCIVWAIQPPAVEQPTEPAPGTTRLTWDAPTSRVNGAPLAATEIRGYSVLLNGVPIGFTAATIFEFATPATAGNVTVVAVDIHGLESIQSAPYRVCSAC